ncbi:MAG: nucleoside kinase [Spirochaetaceae bacterium]|nr:MAG: nucleoside kinase [Spirochaetaceae bacterium]
MTSITVTLPTGEERTIDRGQRVSEVLEGSPRTEHPVVAALVNNQLVSLAYRIEVNAHIKPITLDTPEGRQVYRRTLCFVLTMAATRRLPERRIVIGHSLGDGFYYQSADGAEFSQTEIDGISREMHAIVAGNLPIARTRVSYQDALDYFRERGMTDTELLLKHRNEGKIAVYQCAELMDISHGPLLASTGLLQAFEVRPYAQGLILRYPGERDPYTLTEFHASPILFSVYQEYKQWGKILGVGSAGQLSELTRSRDIREFIRVAEALHDKRIGEIADRISERRDTVRVILIAGPSSSGKTTFAKKLSVQLTVCGLQPTSISLDDFFVEREQTPRDADGNYDFEHLRAIDVTLLNETLLRLFAAEEVEMAAFDFKTGSRSYSGRRLRLPEQGVLLIEGIHGLNPDLIPRIERSYIYKVYVSALTQLNLDDNNRVPTTDNRLIRRLVRDHQFRGYSAIDTLSRWPSVRRGENRNIFPFQDSADSAFNSALDYELGVIKSFAEPLLQEVKPYHEVYHEATRLASFLNNFTHIPDKFVPEHSILREFIGDSGFKY